MPELQKVSAEEAIRARGKLGFSKVRQRGSHVILQKQTAEGKFGCVVPLHRELEIGTLKGILGQAKVSPEEFMANL